MLIDSHAHLSMSKYDKDRDEVIARSLDKGVVRIVEIGATDGFKSNAQAMQLAENNEEIYFTVGLHPHDAKLMNDADWKEVVEVASTHPKVVAIGETGLDFFYNHSSAKDQEAALVKQVGLAKELKKPIVIHDRDAHDETLEILLREKAFDTNGEFHCYSGNLEFAKKIVDLGWMIAIGGVVTFKNAKELQEVAAHIPLESILLETDSPFLTPVPNRGKRNEPWMTVFAAEKIAELRDIDKETVIEQTGKNANKLFKLGL